MYGPVLTSSYSLLAALVKGELDAFVIGLDMIERCLKLRNLIAQSQLQKSRL